LSLLWGDYVATSVIDVQSNTEIPGRAQIKIRSAETRDYPDWCTVAPLFTKGGFMGFTDYIVLALVGLVVGAVAKFLIPGKQGGGIIITAILGIIGSLLGTLGGQQLGIVSAKAGTHWIASIVGAVVVVFIYSLLTRKSDTTT
jgi:uncharacterized membrane protein YeaQ/YmgE (transglycosylase-associated protein family)